MAVHVETDAAFRTGTPKMLFAKPYQGVTTSRPMASPS